MSKLIEQMINKEFSTGEFTHEMFDRLYPGVRAGDVEAITKMSNLAFPYIYRYVVKNVGKITMSDTSEYASYIYETIVKYVKSIAKKGEKSYNSFTSELKLHARKTLINIANKEMSSIIYECNNNQCTECDEIKCLGKTNLDKILEYLNEKEKLVITAYFGMNTERKSINQISGSMGLGRKTVQQIYARAIRKLYAMSCMIENL